MVSWEYLPVVSVTVSFAVATCDGGNLDSRWQPIQAKATSVSKPAAVKTLTRGDDHFRRKPLSVTDSQVHNLAANSCVGAEAPNYTEPALNSIISPLCVYLCAEHIGVLGTILDVFFSCRRYIRFCTYEPENSTAVRPLFHIP